MPTDNSFLINASAVDFAGTANVAVSDVGELRSVADDVLMDLDNFALRPGTHHRVSFRATPGTRLAIRVRAQAWMSLEVLNAPRVHIPSEPGPVVAWSNLGSPIAGGGPATPSRSAISLNAAATNLRNVLAPRPGENVPVTTPSSVFRRIRPNRPIVPGGPIGPIAPPDPPPSLPVDVIVTYRSGDEIGNQRLQGNDQSLAPVRFELDGIDRNEVVDVTFINPNAVPILCVPCYVEVTRSVRTDVVKLPTTMLTRVFNDALRSLTPTVIIDAGRVRASFQGPVAQELGLHSLEADLPGSGSWNEGGATFEPGDIEIMSSLDLFREVLTFYMADLDEVMSTFLVDSQLTDADQEELEDDYFGQTPDFALKIEQLLNFSDTRLGQARLFKDALKELNERYPLLTDAAVHKVHNRADIGVAATYRITGIHGSLGAVGLELDQVKATAHLSLRQAQRQVDAPHGDLPRDRFTIGGVRPLLNFRLDIGDLDIDIDVPPWVDFITSGLATLGAFIIEQGGQALFDYLAGRAEKEVPDVVHRLFHDRSVEIGEFVAEALATIADRDQVFHKAAASRTELAIATINRDQLKVPHDPDYNRRRSPTEGIGNPAPPVLPIDHVATPPQIGPSPEALLGQIDHFVFVMMENRSFDHMLGFLSHPSHGARTDIDGLERESPGLGGVLGGGVAKSRVLGGDLEGTVATPLPGPNPQFRPNLPHHHESVLRQINNGKMNGFASEYARELASTHELNPKGFLNDPERALRFQTKEIVETYADLADKYAVCDRWFSSVPAGTYPNRSCYYTGVTSSLTNSGIIDDAGYLEQLTVFDVLDHVDVDVDWRVFESDVTFARMFKRLRLENQRIRPISEFFAANELPPVTFVDPNFTGMPNSNPNNDDQPPTDVRLGQRFVADVIKSVKDRPEWERTMIVVIYDEHGGFADHVPPPGAPNSSHPGGAADISLSHPDAHTFGVRVPAFIVSPHVAARSVAHQIFDHATVFRTLVQRFAPQFVNSEIIPERVRRARHLGEVLSDQQRVIVDDVAAPSPPVVAASRARPIARVVLDEPEDIEDMTVVLKQLGKPTSRRSTRNVSRLGR
ncbi:MAG: alkaline phosphatase family protein [Phycisphaerales bacterium]